MHRCERHPFPVPSRVEGNIKGLVDRLSLLPQTSTTLPPADLAMGDVVDSEAGPLLVWHILADRSVAGLPLMLAEPPYHRADVLISDEATLRALGATPPHAARLIRPGAVVRAMPRRRLGRTPDWLKPHIARAVRAEIQRQRDENRSLHLGDNGTTEWRILG